MDRNDLVTIAQRLREYVGNPHHVDPMSNAFKQLISDASEALSKAANPQGEPVAQKYDETLMPFVALMRKELHSNAGKGDRHGWLAMPAEICLLEIFYHLGKLQKAVKKSDGDGMMEYAADVANMCMMLLDICGALHLSANTEPEVKQ